MGPNLEMIWRLLDLFWRLFGNDWTLIGPENNPRNLWETFICDILQIEITPQALVNIIPKTVLTPDKPVLFGPK